ncbi:hypothetical protein B0F90DRAFT_1628468 [Multifurca ochricompacta]|uniref:Uncharacterized protein n=1 Tax=Multifurca ochricompacta TaxID=376703 RepID=A0AAD4QMH7_9AGAM|nr:hypothetical protein B0F90DRAFT_1628468 [Multifurca ochricompacta]
MSGDVLRIPADILTYCYCSRMVYVTPGESYEQAINFAQEAFPELRNIDRDLICLEIRVVFNNQKERKTAQIGRMAWSAVVATLARYEIVEIRVSSSPAQPATEPPPYTSRSRRFSDSKGHV